jgi:hypothetical protein
MCVLLLGKESGISWALVAEKDPYRGYHSIITVDTKRMEYIMEFAFVTHPV